MVHARELVPLFLNRLQIALQLDDGAPGIGRAAFTAENLAPSRQEWTIAMSEQIAAEADHGREALSWKDPPIQPFELGEVRRGQVLITGERSLACAVKAMATGAMVLK